MTIELLGDETEDNIIFPNGMKIHIEYGFKNEKIEHGFGILSRYVGSHRKVTLFDKNDKIITEIIEENPHETDIPEGAFNIPNSDGIIY